MCTCGTGRGRVGAGLYNLLNIHIYTREDTCGSHSHTCRETRCMCVSVLSRESRVCVASELCDCVRAGGLWGRHLWVRRRSLWQGATTALTPRHPRRFPGAPTTKEQYFLL